MSKRYVITDDLTGTEIPVGTYYWDVTWKTADNPYSQSGQAVDLTGALTFISTLVNVATVTITQARA